MSSDSFVVVRELSREQIAARPPRGEASLSFDLVSWQDPDRMARSVASSLKRLRGPQGPTYIEPCLPSRVRGTSHQAMQSVPSGR